MDRYEELKCIGRGNYGSAHLVNDRESGRKLVIKKVHLQFLSPKEREAALAEASLLRTLEHPNVVKHERSFEDDGHLHIVMQYCEGGDLAAQLKRYKTEGKQVPEAQVLDWFIQLCFAVQHIHKHRILHRDLKSSNVFLTANNIVRLGDFGIARALENTAEQAQTVVGTPYYMSPEVCENKPYSYSSDIWAVGCILHEMCALDHPFKASNLLGLVFRIVQEEPARLPGGYSDQLRDLVGALLSKSPQNRPGFSAIFQLPLVSHRMLEQTSHPSATTLGRPIQNLSEHAVRERKQRRALKRQAEIERRRAELEQARRDDLPTRRAMAARARQMHQSSDDNPLNFTGRGGTLPLPVHEDLAQPRRARSAAAVRHADLAASKMAEEVQEARPEEADALDGALEESMQGTSRLEFMSAAAAALPERPIGASGRYNWEEEAKLAAGLGGAGAKGGGDTATDDGDDDDDADSEGGYSQDSFEEDEDDAYRERVAGDNEDDMRKVIENMQRQAVAPSSPAPRGPGLRAIRGAGEGKASDREATPPRANPFSRRGRASPATPSNPRARPFPSRGGQGRATSAMALPPRDDRPLASPLPARATTSASRRRSAAPRSRVEAEDIVGRDAFQRGWAYCVGVFSAPDQCIDHRELLRLVNGSDGVANFIEEEAFKQSRS